MGFFQRRRIARLVGLLKKIDRISDPAMKELIQIGQPAVEALSRAATSGEDRYTRQRALSATLAIGGPATMAVLLQALSDPEGEVASRAVWALENNRSAQVSDALANSLGKSGAACLAAVILSNRGDARSLDTLMAHRQITALENFLASHADKASADQLRKCLTVERTDYVEEDIPGAAATNPEGYRMGSADTYRVVGHDVDTTKLKQLARQELRRRGLAG